MMFDMLVRASIGGAVVALMVWALCRFVPRLSPATRAVMWWCVAAKFLIALVWAAPVRVPVLPAEGQSAATMSHVEGSASAPNRSSATRSAIAPYHDPGSASAPYREVAVTAWGAGALVTLGLAARRWRRMRAVIRRSAPAGWQTQAIAEELSARLGLSHGPVVRVSHLVVTPLVNGLWRPVIVLPADRFSRLSADKQRMAICHELAHVQRHDLALGCVPALAERLFFFHPLAVLAAREYALWREAACDEVVLNALDAAPHEYGRLLLDLGVTRPGIGLAAAGAPWSFPNLKRRLVMLGRASVPSTRSRFLTAAAICLSMAALAPLHLVGRAQPVSDGADVKLPLEAATAAQATEVQPARPTTNPATPQPPRHAREAQAPSTNESDDRPRFILLLDDGHTIWHGSSEDHARAVRLKREGEPLAWFRHGGREYVIRDRDAIARIQAIWKPVGDLGAAQGKLGARQGALGAEQGKYGAKQGKLGAQQGKLGGRMGQLGVKQAQLSLRKTQTLTETEQQEMEREHHELEAEMKKLGDEMRQLGEEMRALGEPMRELGEQMKPIGEEMKALGQKMKEASRQADAEMRTLIQRAIQDGTAEVVP